MRRNGYRAPDDDELLGDELVRHVVEQMDPMRGVPIPPPPAAPVPRRSAAARPPWSGWFWRPLAVGAVVAAVVAGAVLGSGAIDRRGGDTAPPAATGQLAAAEPLALPVATNPPPAREFLRTLVDRAAATPDGAGRGRYSYVRMQTWSLETTPAPDGREPAIVAFDEQLWWAADRSGRSVRTTLPAQPDRLAGVAWTGALPAGAARRGHDYRPGELAVVVDAPAAEAAILAGQLSAHQPFDNGPQSPLRAVVDMHHFHVLNSAQRAAALRVLVDTDGIDYRGEVTDRAGRPGVAVSVDSDNGATRDVAVFDANSGDLLSYERVALLASAGPQLRTPAAVSYVLFLARGQTDQIGKPVDR